MTQWFLGDNEEVALIPVFNDSDCETNAVILGVKHENKLKFALLARDKFDKYVNNKKPAPNAEVIKNLFTIFDFTIFGESSYLPYGRITLLDENTDLLKGATLVCYKEFETSVDGVIVNTEYECFMRYHWNEVIDDGYDDGGGAGWTEPDLPGPSPNPTPEPEILLTDEFSEYPCLDNIFKTLTNGTTVDIKNFEIDQNLTASILSFFDITETVDLYLHAETFDNPDISANTNRNPDGNDYFITFNTSYLESATDLSIARTFIHEIVHANLLYQVSMRSGNDFDELSEIYNSMNGDPDQAKEYQHEFMIGIRDLIADNLYEWCRRTSTNVDLEYCKTLAWGGLQKTSAYDSLSESEKSLIHKILINEKLSNNAAKGKNCN